MIEAEKEISDDKQIIKQLITTIQEQQKTVQEQQKQIAELIPKIGNHNVTNNNTKNNIKNKFNIHIYLNETCKDAMNLEDFVKSIQVNIADVMSIGNIGYAKGISNIVIKQLHAIDKHRRPIQCSDANRLTVYVKDNEVWEKEVDAHHPKLLETVETISRRTLKVPELYMIKDPDKAHLLFMKVVGGDLEERTKKNESVVKKISRASAIDKTTEEPP